MAPESEYLFDSGAGEAGQRFASLSALFDHITTDHLDRLGIGEGWRCWEVGAGGPAMPRWLSERVGPSGAVVATDIELRWLPPDLGANVDVRRHDVVSDDPPAGRFDLVHARLVLIHLPERRRALARMFGALRPGGWLLVEDFASDIQPLACPDSHGADQELANRVHEGVRRLLASRGADFAYAPTLPRLLRDAGLTEVGATGYFALALPAAAALERANVAQVRDALAASGHATTTEVDTYLGLLDEGELDVATAPLISAWGRHP